MNIVQTILSLPEQSQYQSGLGDILTVSNCGMCNAYYPYDEYPNINPDKYIGANPYDAHSSTMKSGGMCSELNSHVDADLRPDNCPRAGSCQVILVRY
jgi:hypothetical protein